MAWGALSGIRIRRWSVAPPEVAGMSADAEREALGRAVPPAWASAWGEDATFGVFAVLRVGAAEQRFRWIAPGSFMMGAGGDDDEAYEDERPPRRVAITRGFWLADTPCTQAMWAAVLGENPSYFRGAMRPVENVSAKDVDAFVARVAEYADFRLPSEAEWEYACRAGTETARHGRIDDIAWYDKNSGMKTHDVGRKLPNAWGLYDMLGNVWEWTADSFGTYSSAPVADTFSQRVGRGGGWDCFASSVRAASRFAFEPGSRDVALGFRLLVGQGLRPESAERSDPQAGSRRAREGAPTGASRRSTKHRP